MKEAVCFAGSLFFICAGRAAGQKSRAAGREQPISHCQVFLIEKQYGKIPQ